MTLLLHNQSQRELLTTRLQNFTSNNQQNENLVSAAVVLAVSDHRNTNQKKQGQSCILLTRRSSRLRKHSGQFALPGGKLDTGESVTEAALRELSEELNLHVSNDNVIGLLDDFATNSGFNITPVVVWVEDHQELNANPDEVAAVYEIPFSDLKSVTMGHDDEGLGDEEPGDEEGGIAMETGESNTPQVMSLYLPSVGTSIYSPTAAIIYQFKQVALCGRSTRVSHFAQPKFAWK